MDATRRGDSDPDRTTVTLSSEPPTALNPLPKIAPDRYEIEARLGAGGMGEVFRARDLRLGRAVAIKTSNERFASRFAVEARAISTLNHPHICTLFDVGPDYLVMELVDGETLAARIKRGPLSLSETLRYGEQMAGALAEAHAHQIIHRDLKPANVMVTRHGIKVLDFGLARMPVDGHRTASHVVMGTPAYMSPEQAAGEAATPATDLFSLGLVLYEMATGQLPTPGASLGKLMASGSQATLPRSSGPSSSALRVLDGLIRQLLAKDPGQRPSSAAAVAQTLKALADSVDAPITGRWRLAALAAVSALCVAGGVGYWLYHGASQRRWAREVALPQAASLQNDQPLAAYVLLQHAKAILPGDSDVAAAETSSTRVVSIQSDPAGATVEMQDYVKPGDWLMLGKTPLTDVRIPKGYFRWRLSIDDRRAFVAAPPVTDKMQFDIAGGERTPGQVPIPAGAAGDFIDFVGWVTGALPAFTIDTFEVTNAQYQEFVDHGGYTTPAYWKAPFVQDGKTLTWDQGMALLRDPTGRPGPSRWEGGHFPPGHERYPVTGVSWYEAAAYAEYKGASLPVLLQWLKASPPELAPFIANVSNFSGNGTAAVGTFNGVGPFGTYDMAGNAREWSATASEGSRLALGGGWGTHSYRTSDFDVLPPFDRSPMNGFRTVRNAAPLSASATAPLPINSRDFSKAKPAPDDVFRAYVAMYAYNASHALDAKTEGIVEDTPDWTKERVSYDAGYGGQRLTAYLFVPKHVHPPFQTVLFFPSARVEFEPDSHALIDLQFVDYVIKSGRALLYPIYTGTYERVRRTNGRQVDDLPVTVQRSKEVRRSVDYLVTRPDVDAARIAYLGVSMGTAFGTIFTALEPRFRAIVFLDGGFFLFPPQPGWDLVDFAPRVTKPVLMVNGKYDFSFSPARAAEPLFNALGTPAADKRQVFLETPHDVSQQKDQLSKEVLAWLDKYLGRVN